MTGRQGRREEGRRLVREGEMAKKPREEGGTGSEAGQLVEFAKKRIRT